MAQKQDYNLQMENIIASLSEQNLKPKLLLHACCAPCSSHVLERLSQHFKITIYYYNPNIHPKEEYERRLDELKKFLFRYPLAKDIELIEAPYITSEFFDAVNTKNEPELAHEAEKGERCRRCYELRMKKAAQYASENGFDFFATTLSISPHKDAQKINDIGYTLDGIFPVNYLPSDFKKKGGFLRSRDISAEYGLYRQDYCGCIYSMP